MVTPIRPSLAQMLNGTSSNSNASAAQASPPSVPSANSFSSALQAQKSFFQQVASGQVASGQAPATAPQKAQKITPANFTAADIARATSTPSADPNTPPRRPGSLLNIVV